MEPTQPIDVRERSFSDLLLAMSKTGFQGRKLGEAFKIWVEMLEDEVTIIMGLAGAMIPAGMRKILSFLVDKRYVDVIVSTGANVFHDICESLGVKHYIGSEYADDVKLFGERIDRIYDVFVSEDDLNRVDFLLANAISDMEGIVSSREFIEILADKLKKFAKEESFVFAARERGVPIFCPCIADSSIGIAAALSKAKVVIDTIKDVRELTEIVVKSNKTGVIYIGGGVPKNFIQQAEIVARLAGKDKGGHDYAIQITADSPQWGGLSGATLEESISWGKVSSRSKRADVRLDATVALPIIAHALREYKRKRFPKFEL